MRRILAGMAVLVAAAAMAVAAGFAAFVVAVEAPVGPVPKAAGIVALTGGADRVETALRLLVAGQADMLLVSGVAHGAGLPDLAHRAGLDPALLATRVTLGRTAATTFGNAEEAADWARDHALHSLVVVTSSYHMPRAMLEMRRAMPGVAIHAMPVSPVSLTQIHTMRLLLSEYVKYLAAWLGLSADRRQQSTIVRRSTVDKSVHS